MDGLTKNPGLQYVAEEIFLNLNLDTIKKCVQVNESWRKLLNNPSFWLRKCIKHGIIVDNKLDWEKTVNITRNTETEENLMYYLQNISDNIVVNKSSPMIWAAEHGHVDVVKSLAPLIDNPNAPLLDGRTPIFSAAQNGHIDVIKVLTPFTDNPNAPDKSGDTPIYRAALDGHFEIVNFLASWTDFDDLKEVFLPPIGPYQCEICQVITDTKGEFIIHIIAKHREILDEDVIRSLKSDVVKSAIKESRKQGRKRSKKSPGNKAEKVFGQEALHQ